MMLATVITAGYLLWRSETFLPQRPADTVVWLVCLAVYVLCYRLAGPLARGLWTGYLFTVTVLIWLIYGLAPVLVLVIIGTVLAAGTQMMQEAGARHRTTFIHACQRISMGGMPLIISDITLHQFNAAPFTRSSNFFIITVIMALCFGLTQGLGVWFFGAGGHKLSLFHQSQRARIAGEIMLFALIIPLAVVYIQNGPVMFGALIGLVAGQAIRHAQVTTAQAALKRQIDELSHINEIGQRIGASLFLEDLFGHLQDWAKQLNLKALFIVQEPHDTSSEDFPFVVLDNTRINADNEQIKAIPQVQRMVQEYQTINTPLMDAGFYAFPLYIGGSKVGVMGLVENPDFPLEGRLSQNTLRTVASQIGLRLRNTGLYERTVHLAQNLQYINESVKRVLFNVDQTSALNAACEIAIRITGASKAAVFLANGDESAVYATGYGLTPAHSQRYEAGELLPELTLEALFYRDLPNSELAIGPLLAEYGDVRAMAQVPLRSGQTLIGLLVVFHDEPHIHHEIERELLETVAYQLVAAIDNVYLVTALEHYATEQTELLHLSRVLTSTLDLDATINHVTSLLQQILGVSWVGVGLLPPSANYLQFYRSDDSSRYAVLLDDLPEVYNAYRRKSPSLLNLRVEDEELSPETQEWMSFQGVATLGVMVMVVENQVVGALFLGQAQPHQFTVSQERLLEVARNQVGSQIHNALQYQETQTALDWRLQQLGLIEGIAQQMSSSLNMQTLTRGLLEAALRATTADMVSFSLLNDSGDLDVMVAQVQVTGDIIYQTEHHMVVDGAVKEVFREGEALIIADNSRYPYYQDVFGRVYQSSLVVPLVHQGKVIGVIDAESDHLAHFNSEQAVFLMSLAGHAAVSIQNARLLQDRQSQIETLDSLRELSVRLSVELDESVALNRILQTALNVLKGEAALLVQLESQSQTFTQRLQLGDATDVAHLQARIAEILPNAISQRQVQIQPYESDDICRAIIVIPIEADEVVSGLCIMLRRPHQDSDRNTAALIGIQADAHLRNLALHQHIRAQNSRMHAILDSTRDGVIMFDQAGTIIDVNASASGLLGIQFEEYIGKNLQTDLLPTLTPFDDAPDDLLIRDNEHSPLVNVLRETAKNLAAGLLSVTTGALEVRYDHKSRYLHQVGTPVLDANGAFMGRLLTFRDVTDEQQLAAYRDEIASMVVHDLRSPLGSMITGLNLMREVAQNQHNDDALEVIALVLSSGMRMLDLVNSILDVSRLERGYMPIQRIWITLPMMIADALGTLVGLLQEGDLVVEQDIPADLPPVYVDVDKIRRVLINLLDNAMRYTPKGGRLLIHARLKEDGKVHVMVADDGPGISEDQIKRVFEKFSQGDQNQMPRRGEKGSGLGLTYCKLALEAHGESIWIERKSPLAGACLMFTLPAQPMSEPAQTRQHA